MSDDSFSLTDQADSCCLLLLLLLTKLLNNILRILPSESDKPVKMVSKYPR